MVGTKPIPDPATVASLVIRLNDDQSRYLRPVADGHAVLSVRALAILVAEIVDEHAEQITTERDALAEDLAWELNATRTATPDATVRTEGGAS